MTGFSIGEKIRRMRVRLGLTQEELASRTELSKGFISQLERDLTSPSIQTLMDILEALGTNIRDFFNESTDEKVVFDAEDIFVKADEEAGYEISWLVTTAQKNQLEPIMLTLAPGGRSIEQKGHEGEEFGHVLAGSVVLNLGDMRFKVRKGSSFCFRPTAEHYLENGGKLPAKVIWVSTPPSF